MSVAETHEWNQVKDKDKVIPPLKQAFQFFLTDTTGFWVFTLWTLCGHDSLLTLQKTHLQNAHLPSCRSSSFL